MKKVFIKSVVVFIIVVSSLNCDSVMGPTDRDPTLHTITTYQGAWSGTTSEGYAISFTVAGNTITSFVIDILQSAPGEPDEKATYSLSKTMIINGADFMVKVSLNPNSDQSISPGLSVSGHFASTTSAEGISIPSMGAGVTWKADKK
jgi:hypothetical protein